jgi:ribonucleoside-diphosphate reductase alpha chain
VYEQAPYEAIDKETYKQLRKECPAELDWDELSAYERGDTTTGTQELACSAGSCEIL